MYWMLLPLRRYADFSGRSRRLEYWMFTLFILLGFALIFGLSVALADGTEDGFSGLGIALFAIFGIAIFVPSLAVQVRRFHDQNRSGWFVLLGLIPYIGGIISFVFMCIPGTIGANDYGPDPKDDDSSAVADVFA